MMQYVTSITAVTHRSYANLANFTMTTILNQFPYNLCTPYQGPMEYIQESISSTCSFYSCVIEYELLTNHGQHNIIECLLYNYMGVNFVLIKRKRNFVKAPIFFVCQWHCVVKYMCQEYMSDYIMGDFQPCPLCV